MGKLGPRTAAATALLLLLTAAGVDGVGAAPGSASISGRVLGTGDVPVAGICVSVENQYTVTTDADGVYSMGGLPASPARVQYSDCRPSPTYLDQWYLGRADHDSADQVLLTDGLDTPLGDVHLQEAASLTGTVTDPGGAPVSGWCVEATAATANGYEIRGNTTTGPDGTWRIDRLRPSEVRVRFHACGAATSFFEQWWSGATDFQSATPVVLTAGDHRSGIDAHLVAGVSVTGRVTDPFGNPLAGIGVSVNPIDQGNGTGTQTGPDGRYRTPPLASGTYKVQFGQWSPLPTWATEFWNDKPTWSSADLLSLSTDAGPEHSGVDAALAPAAAVQGRVTDVDGNPLSNICVDGRYVSQDDGVGGTRTAADGTYTLGGLPSGEIEVVFHDCNATGPWAIQWWNGAASSNDAETITLAAGTLRTGIDARLARGSAITGRVTDTDGNPLREMCAQASTPDRFGGIARTDDHGDYRILLSTPGDYRVQFVDCDGVADRAGQWWNDQPVTGTPGVVTVGAGQTVGGIDAVLSPGSSGSVTGRVTNINGVGMTGACALVYLPDQFVRASPVASDGSYSIEDVPSGTFALAFVGCERQGDPQPRVRNPQSATWGYAAMWWKDRLLDISGSGDGGPDPFAQGAQMVTVSAGAQIPDMDHCFGCTAVTISSATASAGSIQLTYASPGLLDMSSSASTGSGHAAPAGALVYSAECTSSDGGATGTATGSATTLTVTGLTPGATYSCRITASDGSVVVGASTPSAAVVLPAEAVTTTTSPATTSTSVPTTTAPGSGRTTGTTASGTGSGGTSSSSGGRQLAFTGSSSTGLLAPAGLVLLLVGLGIMAADRRRRAV